MNIRFSSAVLLLAGLFSSTSVSAQFINNENSCPAPILSRLDRHEIQAGETVESIAQQYNLLPETLIRLNPSLQQDTLPVGTEILIPPFNGVRIEVPVGTTWKDLETAYGVRADVLFELNGCNPQPQVVFLPGVAWQSEDPKAVYSYTGLTQYPLPQSGEVLLDYGWYQNSETEQRSLHSGIDLSASVGTSVLAAEAGTVTFAGQHPIYGNFIIISHPGGKQTRYGHLKTIALQNNQAVTAGQTIGTVGTTGKPHAPDPHLHFEVRYQTAQGWVAQDPEIHLSAISE
ncbi:MAG: M23 family metallopeptidase [Halothece sp. Uz-M2-17]|nr:M23 family metallopeptidase [Halothece sp. Uz-M2-17]